MYTKRVAGGQRFHEVGTIHATGLVPVAIRNTAPLQSHDLRILKKDTVGLFESYLLEVEALPRSRGVSGRVLTYRCGAGDAARRLCVQRTRNGRGKKNSGALERAG